MKNPPLEYRLQIPAYYRRLEPDEVLRANDLWASPQPSDDETHWTKTLYPGSYAGDRPQYIYIRRNRKTK